jgi:3-deoxy-D-manno-octulosonic-acid transferase
LWRGAANTRAWSRRSSSTTASRSPRSSEADIPEDRNPGGLLGEAALSLYGVAGRVAAPIAGAVLRLREREGKEDGARRGERFGVAGKARPAGPLVWVHAASVGETVAAVPLIDRLTGLGSAVLLTTGTVTAAEVARRRLPSGAIHQFVPIDTPTSVARFLDYWRPGLALFAESELWPTMLRSIKRRALPLAVVNARMSERSFRSWSAVAPLARAVVGRAELFLAQTLADADRLKALGARRVVVCGNLKFDAPPPPADEAAVAALRQAIGDRPVLVAASTHRGEEAAVIAAHALIAFEGARLLTILAPRHPERGDQVAAEIAAAGLSYSRRSQGEPIDASTEVYLADTIGEMGLWYRLADFAFLGGSMVPHGGQNPIEPAKLQVPILHGGHVGNFRDVYDALVAARAVVPVEDAASLAAAVTRLIAAPEESDRLTREARACVERFGGALERTLGALEPYLAKLGLPDEASPRA